MLTATTTVTKKVAAVTVTAATRPESAGEDEGDAASGDPTGDIQARVSERVAGLMAEFEKPLAVRITVLPGSPHAPDQRRRVI